MLFLGMMLSLDSQGFEPSFKNIKQNDMIKLDRGGGQRC